MYQVKECGKRIQKLRKERGLTQEQVAEMLSITADSLSRIERGIRGCTVDLLADIADIFDCSLDYIVQGKEPCEMLTVEVNELLKDRNPEQQKLALKILKGILENI